MKGSSTRCTIGRRMAEQARIAREVVRTYRERPQDRHLVLVETRSKWGYDLRNAIRAIDASIQAPTVFSEGRSGDLANVRGVYFLSIAGNGQDVAAMRDWISYREPDSEGGIPEAPHRNAAAYAWIKQSNTLTQATQHQPSPATATAAVAVAGGCGSTASRATTRPNACPNAGFARPPRPGLTCWWSAALRGVEVLRRRQGDRPRRPAGLRHHRAHRRGDERRNGRCLSRCA